MNTMIVEILACLVAAGLLGLICGWLIKASLAKRKLARVEADWTKKHEALEARSQQDIENLEDQLQHMGEEVKTLTNSNRSLNESLQKNEASVYKSRTDAIELNRQQAETQERLQRIIMEKDEELNALKSANNDAELGKTAKAAGLSAAVAAKATDVLKSDAANNDNIDAHANSLAAKREAWERERRALAETLPEDQQTVALDQNDIPNDNFDKTVKLDTSHIGSDKLDDTDQMEDSTIALDDTLSLTDDDPTDQGPLGGMPRFSDDDK